MQIGSTFSMLGGAPLSPRPATPPPAPKPGAEDRPSLAAGTGDINSLLAYARAANAQALRARAVEEGAEGARPDASPDAPPDAPPGDPSGLSSEAQAFLYHLGPLPPEG